MTHGVDRAIVIGLGNQGASVAAAARVRRAARPPNGQRTAWIEALTAADALQGLSGAVSSISRLRSDALLGGGHVDGGARVVRVLVVAALSEVAPDEALTVARAVRRAVEGVAEAQVVGMVIMPDGAALGARSAAETREELRAWLAAGSTHSAPAFDGGCICLGAANQHGFTLSEAERAALAAEMVVQWLSGPLDDAHWQAPAMAGELTSAGVAAWVYPKERLQTWVAEKAAHQLVDAWLGPAVEGTLATPDRNADIVTRSGLSRQSLGEEAAPSSFFGDLNISANTQDFMFGGQWRNDYTAIEAEYHTRLEALTERRDSLDKNVVVLAARIADEAVRVTSAELDAPMPGRVHSARKRLAALRATLGDLKKEAAASAERRFETIGLLDAERERLAAQMDLLAERLPRSQMAALGLLVLPWRLWSAYKAARAMRVLAGSAAALLQQCLAVTVEIVRDDQCQEIYADAAEAVAALETDVLRLSDRLEEARAQIEPFEEGLCGALSFPTECSLLTSEIIDGLTEPLWQDTGFALREAAAQGLRLADWLNDPPNVAAIAARCVAFGRERSAELGKLTAEDLFTRRFPSHPERWEAVQSMVVAADSFLRWDEAQLSGIESGQAGVSRWLGLSQGESSPLFAEVASRIGKVRAIGTQDGTRITAVQIVQGVAVDALILDEEVGDGFEADIDVAVV
ncbi:MAG: hypothetical protein U0822_08440 [Anaerolineae bacterium]